VFIYKKGSFQITNKKNKKMKKTIFTLAITAFIAGTVFTSCESSVKKTDIAEEKVQDAKNNELDAQINLNKAQQDSIAEYKQFKKESEEKLAQNEKSIAEFKTRIAKEKKENKAEYEKKLAELEQKNTDMKKVLDDYKNEGKDKWTSFKTKFNHDMDEITNAMKNVTIEKSK
jgi:hypothetical protein